MTGSTSARALVAAGIARAAAILLPPRVMRNKRFAPLWERRGYHVLPDHYYEPVPAKTGRDRINDAYPDVALDMVASRTFDGRIQLLEYVPTLLTGPPGAHPAS